MITHWVSYEPKNMGRDYVVTACGRLVPITDYSSRPTCKERPCQTQAARHRIRLSREVGILKDSGATVG